MLSANATTGERFAHYGLRVFAALVCLFLCAPILAIVPLSFSAGSFFYYPLPGFSLRWYVDFFTSSFWGPSIWNSLIVAVSVTGLSTALGTVAALGLSRARFPGRAFVVAVLISPMIVPVIIVAVGVYFVFAPLGLANSYAGLILAHTALATPFVVVTVTATLSGFDATLLRAGASLGAGPVLSFFRITLPLIVVSIALMAGVEALRRRGERLRGRRFDG